MSEDLILEEYDFEPDQDPRYVIARLSKPTLFSNIVRGITEDEDMEISEVVFKFDTLKNENGRVSGEIVGVLSSLGIEIIDPEETGTYMAVDLECHVTNETAIDLDYMTNNELTISVDDLPCDENGLTL